jgi:mono/diheme cytochrome c family protein
MNRPAFPGRLAAVAAVLIVAGQEAGAADVFNGREIYEMHCQGCHGIDGQSMEPGTPDFTRGESLLVPDAELFRQLWDGGHMPSYRGMIEDSDLRDVIAYVRTLQR